MPPGGIWHWDYLVAVIDDLLEGNGKVRLYTVKDVKEPFEFIFLLKGADLKRSWPKEQKEVDEVGGPDLADGAAAQEPVKRPRKVSNSLH